MIHDHKSYAAGHPGWKGGGGTSEAAADDMAPRAPALRHLAKEKIAAAPNGLTAEELSDACGVERVAMQPRTSELEKAGVITDSGIRRRNRSGKNAIVWVIAEPQGNLFGGGA